MSYRTAAAILLALSLAFLGAGLIQGQSTKTKKEDPKVEKEDEKDGEDDEEGEEEDEKEEEKPLTAKEMKEMMEAVETAWNRLKIHAKNKMGDKAATAADEIAEHAPKLLRYDGKVLTGDNKDKLAREQKDYKDWAAAMQKAAEDYSKYAKKSDWDKAGKEKEKLNETCGDCHKVYKPPKVEEKK